jgi:hypothetical protein
MAAHTDHPQDLIVQLQEGTRITLRKDEHDHLVTVGFEPAAGSKKYQPGDVPAGLTVVGFGPWPSWGANVRNGQATILDDESGIFEPERLFVFREQYCFLTNPADAQRPLSLGPVHKVWWVGTEGVVQARHADARH